MAWKQYVLQSAPGEPGLQDRLQKALGDLERSGQGPHFDFAYAEELAPDLRRTIWLGKGGSALIKLLDDTTIPARYLIVEAETDAGVDQIAAHLGKSLPIISIEQLRQRARQAMASEPGTVIRLALGAAGSTDQATLDIVITALRHSEQEVRHAGAMAAGLLQWPAFIPELRRLANEEPDQATRELAERALAACERVAQGERGSQEES